MEMNCAMVEKDMITITNLEIKRVLNKKRSEEGHIWTTEGSQCASFERAATCLSECFGHKIWKWNCDQDECKKSGPEQNSIGAGPLHLCSWTTEGADRRCGVLSPFFGKTSNMYLYITQNVSPNVSLNLPIHQICHEVCPQINHQIWRFTKLVTKFGDKLVP